MKTTLSRFAASGVGAAGGDREAVSVRVQVEHPVTSARLVAPVRPGPRFVGAKRLTVDREPSHHDHPDMAVEQLLLRARPGRVACRRSVEICHFPPGPGNGRTYTSGRPDSFEAYASQRPSGENIAPVSMAGLFRNAAGVPGFQPDSLLPSNGRIIRSMLVCGEVSSNARNLPTRMKRARQLDVAGSR